VVLSPNQGIRPASHSCRGCNWSGDGGMEDFLPSETIRQGYARLMARCFSGDR